MVRTLLLEALKEQNPVCTHNSTYALQQQRDFDSFDFRIFQNSNSCPSHTEPCLPLSCHRSLSHSLISLFLTPSESIPLCVTFRTDLAPVFRPNTDYEPSLPGVYIGNTDRLSTLEDDTCNLGVATQMKVALIGNYRMYVGGRGITGIQLVVYQE